MGHYSPSESVLDCPLVGVEQPLTGIVRANRSGLAFPVAEVATSGVKTHFLLLIAVFD